jgi:hypothetical protein
MSLTKSKYRKLGLKIVSLQENFSCTPKKPSMVEERKNYREDDSINMLFEQALMTTKGRNDGEFSPNPSMSVDNNMHVSIKRTLWRDLVFQGTS